MTFKSLFGQITILSLSLVNFRVSRFYVSHLTHETFKLCLQNTLNMSKTVKVYFGVLHIILILYIKFGEKRKEQGKNKITSIVTLECTWIAHEK